MIDGNKKEHAEKTYRTLCETIEKRGWNYLKKEENLMVEFSLTGKDIPVRIFMWVEENTQLIRIISPMLFKVSEENRVDFAIAVCAASHKLVDGNFAYDISDGNIEFRLTSSFRNRLIGEELINYLISCTLCVVDHYNDTFLALDKGFLSISDFMKNE